MVMGSFSGWLALYYLLYAAFIPAINLLLAPVLLVWLRNGKLTLTSWRKYLGINAFINVFGFYVVPYSYVRALFPYESEDLLSFSGLLWVAIVMGFVLQEFFFIVWLFSYLRKKNLSSLYYQTWGWGFVMLTLLPNAIYFAWMFSQI